MPQLKRFTWSASSLAALLLWTGSAHAVDISGTIAATLTIMEDSRLTGNVTCTVTGAPCITFGVPDRTLELNGYSITGLGDPVTACAGGSTAGEIGIEVDALRDVVIRGPGVVERFRNHGIRLRNSTGVTVIGVTTATNCLSGIFVPGGGGHVLERNVSIRNGNLMNPCGGI